MGIAKILWVLRVIAIFMVITLGGMLWRIAEDHLIDVDLYAESAIQAVQVSGEYVVLGLSYLGGLLAVVCFWFIIEISMFAHIYTEKATKKMQIEEI